MKSSALHTFLSRCQISIERSRLGAGWLVFAAAALFGGAVSWVSGQDINWDWQNYHDYGAWALLNGRLWVDVAPASIQSFLNPTALLPDYFLRNLLPMPYGAIIAGAIQASSLVFIFLIARVFLDRLWLSAAAVLLAASGPIFLSEMGTSFPDLLTAIPIMAGIYFQFDAPELDRRKTLVAGILLGIGVGLKLTNAPYAIGAVASALFRRDRSTSLLYLAIGGAIGGLFSGGPWGYLLWREFGSPVFPFYNAIFKAPEGPPVDFRDSRFFPSNIGEWLAYPFLWLAGQHPTAELPFRDARFAVLAALTPLALGYRLALKSPVFLGRECGLFIFFAVSYIAWSLLFSIQRYAVPLELLAGVVALIVIKRVSPTRFLPLSAIGTTALVVILSQPPDWGRRPWSDAYIPAESPGSFREPATFFMLDVPTSFIVRHLPEGSRFFSIATRHHIPLPEGGKFDLRIKTGLNSPLPGGYWTINIQGARNNLDGLERYGLIINDAAECRLAEAPTTDISKTAYLEFCPLTILEKKP